MAFNQGVPVATRVLGNGFNLPPGEVPPEPQRVERRPERLGQRVAGRPRPKRLSIRGRSPAMAERVKQRRQGGNGGGRSRVGPAGRGPQQKPKLDCTKAPTAPNGPACPRPKLREDRGFGPPGNCPIYRSLHARGGHGPETGGMGQRETPKTVKPFSRSLDSLM